MPGKADWEAYKQAILERTDFAAIYADVAQQKGPNEGGWVTGLCPFHDDHNASFSFNLTSGSWACHAACGKGSVFDYIIKARGLEFRDAEFYLGDLAGIERPGAPKASARKRSKTGISWPEEMYSYTDELGQETYQVVRERRPDGSKTFVVRRPTAPGVYESGQGDAVPVPYELPRLLAAFQAVEPVLVVEGEKDVHTLLDAGFVATCNHGGAMAWKDALHAKWFPAGAEVVLCPDADEPGIDHMNAVGASLTARGCRVRLVLLGYQVAEKHGKDVTDWLSNGHSPEDFRRLLEQAPPWEPPKPPVPTNDAGRATSENASLLLTDEGFAERIARRHRGELLYVDPWSYWLIYDGSRWKQDESSQVVAAAAEVGRAIAAEADYKADQSDKKRVRNFSESCQNLRRIRSGLGIAFAKLAALPADFDRDPFTINVTNGTLDLRTGKLRPHAAADRLTKIAGVPYEPAAKCPRWEQFLLEVMNDDIETALFLQRVIGWALTGDVTEDLIFLQYGTGANGKTTFNETIKHMLGDYAKSTPSDTFLEKRGANIPEDIARLQGVRFVTAAEVDEGRRLDESLVKWVTGGDTITARFLHGHFFDFKPQFKIFLAANNRPVVRGTDLGIWRRIRLIPFEVSFPEGDPRRDPLLPERLHQELPGIFAWAVKGCRAWQEHGLPTPERVKLASAEYRGDMDFLGQFLEESCIVGVGTQASLAGLYARYKSWCEHAGIDHPMTRNMFSRRLTDRGVASEHRRDGRYFAGIQLRAGA